MEEGRVVSRSGVFLVVLLIWCDSPIAPREALTYMSIDDEVAARVREGRLFRVGDATSSRGVFVAADVWSFLNAIWKISWRRISGIWSATGARATGAVFRPEARHKQLGGEPRSSSQNFTHSGNCGWRLAGNRRGAVPGAPPPVGRQAKLTGPGGRLPIACRQRFAAGLRFRFF